MRFEARTPDIRLFSTAPQSSTANRESYIQNVTDVARWSEEAGCEGILVYTDNSLVDPWLLSQIIIQNTTRLCPLVAVATIYIPPHSVRKDVGFLGPFFLLPGLLHIVALG